MKRHMGKMFLAAAVAALCICDPSSAAVAQDNLVSEPEVRVAANDSKAVFKVELVVYSISTGQSPGDITYYSDGEALATGKERIENVLKKSVGMVFEDVHILDICEFISDTYDINVILDNRVIRPRKSKNGEGTADPPDAEYVTDGIIDYIKVSNVALWQAFESFLRPLGLDYSVQSSFIWISTPEKIASESFGFFYRPTSVFTLQQEGAYVFHNKETVLLGKSDLNWSGKPGPSDPDIRVLTRPTMILLEGEKGEIHVGDSTPIQYLEAAELGGENTYELKTLEESAGFRTSMIVKQLKDVDQASLELTLDLSIVGEREPLEGVALNVGKPAVTHVSHAEVHKITLGRWASLIGSAEPNNAVFVLLKVSPYGRLGRGDTASSSQTDEEGNVKEYVVEARFMHYLGRLNEENLKAMVADSRAHKIGPNVFRLEDGIVPLRKKDIDFTDPETLIKKSKLRGFELMSAPRITLMGKAGWSDARTTYKLVVMGESPVTGKNFDQILHILAPENYELPLSMEELTGHGIIVDITTGYIPYILRRIENGKSVESTGILEANTGILLAVGVDDTDGSRPPVLDVYSQVQFKTRETGDLPGSLEEATARLAFFDVQDRVETVDGEWITYLASVSDEEHYITLISVIEKSREN